MFTGGLAESVCEHITSLHNQLNMEALDVSSKPQKLRKDKPIVRELVDCLDLLRNFMHNWVDGKVRILNLVELRRKKSFCGVR